MAMPQDELPFDPAPFTEVDYWVAVVLPLSMPKKIASLGCVV
jgi:hypothetical protein